jgi:hypothetical protein
VTAGEPQHANNYALQVQQLPVLPHSARPTEDRTKRQRTSKAAVGDVRKRIKEPAQTQKNKQRWHQLCTTSSGNAHARRGDSLSSTSDNTQDTTGSHGMTQRKKAAGRHGKAKHKGAAQANSTRTDDKTNGGTQSLRQKIWSARRIAYGGGARQGARRARQGARQGARRARQGARRARGARRLAHGISSLPPPPPIGPFWGGMRRCDFF